MLTEQFKLSGRLRQKEKIERVWLYMLANKDELFRYRKLKRLFSIGPDFYKNNVSFLLKGGKIKKQIIENIEKINKIEKVEEEKEKAFYMWYLGFKLKYQDGYFFTLFGF